MIFQARFSGRDALRDQSLDDLVSHLALARVCNIEERLRAMMLAGGGTFAYELSDGSGRIVQVEVPAAH